MLSSRRQMMVTTLGSGFALAVRPVGAATVTTASDGLDSGEVKIPTATGAIPAYRAMPARGDKDKKKGAGKGLPVVLVVHEIFGVHEHIKDVCRRLAREGYFAVAPELYARQGDVSKMADAKEIVAKVASKVPDAQVLSDLDATVAWAKSTTATTGAADVSRLGITGFCWGGRITWLYAAHAPSLRAGVAWYGRLTNDKDPLHPQHPIDIAASIKAPVLGLYGAEDQGIAVATVEEMRKALAQPSASKAARASQIIVYPGAGHAFFADYRPSFRKEAADDGWNRLLAWLRSNGVA